MMIKAEISSCKTCIYRHLLFGSLSNDEYDLVNKSRKETLYKKGKKIKFEGEAFTSFLYLRKGLVKLYKTDNVGKDHILSINKPGDFISLLHVFSNDNYQYNIAAIEDTLVCEVELSVIKELIKTNGEFALNIISRMGKIADDVIASRFDQAKLQIKGKIATIILFFSDQVYRKKRFRMPVTRREIGELISMSTENVIRTLSEFKKDNIVKFEGKEIIILDYTWLVTISKAG